MKDEQLKKILKKSTLETSDDFINNLMESIETSQEVPKSSFWSSFRITLIFSALLLCIISYTAFILTHSDFIGLEYFSKLPKTPFFLLLVLGALVAINYVITLNEQKKKNYES